MLIKQLEKKKQELLKKELHKIKNYLYENTDFDIGIIEHLTIEEY